MIFLLTLLFIFVPYSFPNAKIPFISDYDLSELSLQKDYLVVLFDQGDNSDYEIIAENYNTIQIASIYFTNIEFAFYDAESTEYAVENYNITTPSIFYVHEGQIIATYSFPDSENRFLAMCNFVSKDLTQIPVIKNRNELIENLDFGPFTILTPEYLFYDALNAQRSLSNDLGFVDIIKVSDELLNSLNLSTEKISLFRREDGSAVSVDFGEIMTATVPIYRILGPRDLEEYKPIFALFCDEIGVKEADFLYEIGEKYFDHIIVGYGKFIVNYADKFIEGFGGNELHQVIVFNYYDGYFFDASKYFDGFYENKNFEVSEWKKCSIKMIDDIINKVLLPSYLSESEEFNNSLVYKIVGKNYEKIVMDENYDVVVLYIKENDESCQDFFSIFESFAEECSKLNLTFLKFCFINIELNTSPLRYPLMGGLPHVQFYPSHNKTNNWPMLGGKDRDSIIRLIKTFSIHEIPFDAKPIDKYQIANDMMQLADSLKRVNEEDLNNLINLMKQFPIANEKNDDDSGML